MDCNDRRGSLVYIHDSLLQGKNIVIHMCMMYYYVDI